MKKQRKSSRKILHRGKFKQLVCVDGWEFVERVNCGGIVVMLAETDQGNLVLIDQYRIPVGKRVIEFPAGLANDTEAFRGESLRDAARREFLEEAGYKARRMTFLASGPANPAISGDIMNVFLAEGLTKATAGGGDGTESINVHEVPFGRIDEWLARKRRQGFLVDPKVYAGIYLLEKLRKKKKKRKGPAAPINH